MEDIIITTTDTFFSYPDDIQRKINALWDETSKRALEE